jgi:hypothetical protein
MAQAQYDFPILNQEEILRELKEILPPNSAFTLSAADLKKPTPQKWQQFYIDILCEVFDLQVSFYHFSGAGSLVYMFLKEKALLLFTLEKEKIDTFGVISMIRGTMLKKEYY